MSGRVLAAVLAIGVAACSGDRLASPGSRDRPVANPAPRVAAVPPSRPTPMFLAPSAPEVAAMLGSRIAAGMDDDDRRHAYEAQLLALEEGGPGAPVAWENPDSGRSGTVVPGPIYRQSGAVCRQFSHTVRMEGPPKIARGTACRQADGGWGPAT